MTQGNQMLNDIKTKHREVARLSFEGMKPALISTQTGIGVATVYKILRDPICQAYIGGLGDKVDDKTLSVRERLMNLNSKALDCIEDILDADSKAPYSVQAQSARDVLDRTGNKAPDKIDINHTLQGKSDEDIDAQIASLESQINANFQQDSNGGGEDAEDAEDDDNSSSSSSSPSFTINPKTDCRE